ncbi:hypothetical protein ALC56_08837 [Trachymyrmex septentrionalis]|uniref:Uncharacterized protein n=1 Tax=Trachymyrmex septentrionalis TaxID=34720 RepID=A0A195F9J1_9HYME|nr:hypothetical protein ALC56_08837 [Trachymyrmex septentrionalis]
MNEQLRINSSQSELKRVKADRRSDLARDTTGRKCHANARLFCDVGEQEDPSRERAAGTSHSQDTGTTVADLVRPPGGEGRTPPLRARSLLDPPFWIIRQCFRVTSITLDPARVKIRVGPKVHCGKVPYRGIFRRPLVRVC